MALKDFKRLDFSDANLNKIQENISLFIDQLDFNLLSGNLLEQTQGADPQDIVIGTSTTLVSHGLGRSYRGFMVVDQTGNATIWRDSTYTVNKDKFIPLIASSSVTVKLWVY